MVEVFDGVHYETDFTLFYVSCTDPASLKT